MRNIGWKKILLTLLSLPVILFGIVVAGIVLFFPRSIPIENLVIERTAQRIERGRYLVNNVAFCMNCHGERDWGYMSGPVREGTLGKGANNPIFGGQGIHAANITPFSLGNWSDGEIKRAISSGLKPDGSPVNPEMPHFTYNKMAEDDLHAIIAYLRTLPSIDHQPPKPNPPFLLNLAAKVLPKPYKPRSMPDQSDSVAYGAYLVQIAECRACHGPDLSGGDTLVIPGGSEMQSVNLTPVPGSRIASWSQQEFISMFKMLQNRSIEVPEGGMNSVMPWYQYAEMTEEDIAAIYDYLRKLTPVDK